MGFIGAFRPLFESALRVWDEVASLLCINKKLRSFHFGVSLELLAGFVAAALLRMAWPGPYPASNSPPGLLHLMVQICRSAKNKPHPIGWGLFLELLARFELATSSLPRIWGLCPHEVSSQRISESLVSQQVFQLYY